MVFDVTGRLVSELADGRFPAGHHVITWNGSTFPAGLYFLKLEAAGSVQNRKMLLVK